MTKHEIDTRAAIKYLIEIERRAVERAYAELVRGTWTNADWIKDRVS
jgi:hypothetical protein